jgi:hypothetical protein
MTINLVQIASVPEVCALWPWVREGLLEVKSRCRARWMPEDVYAAIRRPSAFLWLIRDDVGFDLGFIVVQVDEDTDGRCLFLWALWGEAHELVPRKDQLYEEIKKLARSVGARRLRWDGRKGWTRMMQPSRVRYVCEEEL